MAETPTIEKGAPQEAAATASSPPPYSGPPQSNSDAVTSNPVPATSNPVPATTTQADVTSNPDTVRSNPDAVTPAANNATPAPQQQQSTNEKGVNTAPKGAPALAYPTATPLTSLGVSPMPVDCPFCHMRGMTTVEQVHSSLTHMSAALCCLLCLCLVFVPYAAGFGDDSEHRCGACKKLLAIARNNGRVEVLGYAPPVPVAAQPQQPPANMPTYA